MLPHPRIPKSELQNVSPRLLKQNDVMVTKYILYLILINFSAVIGYENGLARTPQMGWNTWNHFGCSISEETILSAAHALVDQGLKDLGYNCRPNVTTFGFGFLINIPYTRRADRRLWEFHSSSLSGLGWFPLLLGWHSATREKGTNKPQADPKKFPRGIKHVANQVHKLGLKVCYCSSGSFCLWRTLFAQLGIYSDAGT